MLLAAPVEAPDPTAVEVGVLTTEVVAELAAIDDDADGVTFFLALFFVEAKLMY